jgi:hypothetical protein
MVAQARSDVVLLPSVRLGVFVPHTHEGTINMRGSFLALIGASFLVVAGCGAEAQGGPSEKATDDLGDSDIGVSTSELTNCSRTELVNAVVTCGDCDFRLMMNNFECSEGVVGQASSETLRGTGDTPTNVATLLFGQPLDAWSPTGDEAAPWSIATQWGHAYASRHFVSCLNRNGRWGGGVWTMNPWDERPGLESTKVACWAH